MYYSLYITVMFQFVVSSPVNVFVFNIIIFAKFVIVTTFRITDKLTSLQIWT